MFWYFTSKKADAEVTREQHLQKLFCYRKIMFIRYLLEIISIACASNRLRLCQQTQNIISGSRVLSLPPLKYYLSIRTIASFGWVVCDV